MTATGSPLGGGGAAIVVAGAGYLVVAAAVAFIVLPLGLGLTGAALLLAQIAVLLAGAALTAYIAIVAQRSAAAQAALLATVRELGWSYTPDVSDRLWGGSIDEQIPRKRRRSTQYLDALGTALPFDSAVRTFTVGDGDGALTHTTRAVRIPLLAEAPRLVVRSRSGGGALSVLPRKPRRGSELRLEGNFSDVFEVSVPAGYERDALYLLTPDLMAILLDSASDLDMEIVDRTLHVYLAPENLTAPGRLERFITTIDVLHERFGRRTRLYRDENAPPLPPLAPRRAGDTLSEQARSLPTRGRVMPVVLGIAVPFVPLAIGIALANLL